MCIRDRASSCPGSGLAHAVGLAAGDHGGGVVQEPVQEADGGGVFGEEPAPVLERPVRRDPEGSTFVRCRDEASCRSSASMLLPTVLSARAR